MHGPEDSLPSDAQSNVLSSEVFSRDSERCLDGRIERLSEFPSAVGGQADIYEGLLGNQKVAIKIRRFFQRSVHFENTSSKLWREYLAWTLVSHPNVHECWGFTYDFSPKGSTVPSLISPWMSNGNLTMYLDKHPEVDRLKILLAVAEGLAVLHENAPVIIHGDIRAANVLVKDDGSPCITDFGLSKLPVFDSMNTIPEFSGSIRWMSPEVLKEEDVLDVKSDIWAYGMTILEVFSGQFPYHEVHSVAAVLFMIVQGELPKQPSDWTATNILANEIWALCQKTWNLEPKLRPTMREVVAILTSLIDHPIYTDRLPTPSPRDVEPLPTMATKESGSAGDVAADLISPMDNTVDVRRLPTPIPHDVGALHTMTTREPGSPVQIIESGIVCQVGSTNTLTAHFSSAFLRLLPESDVLHDIKDHVRIVGDEKEADFIVDIENRKVIFTTNLKIVTDYGFGRFPYTVPVDPVSVATVLHAASQWKQHVEVCSNAEWASQIHIEFVLLKRDSDHLKPLYLVNDGNNEVCLYVNPNQDEQYAMTIRNDSVLNLHVSIVMFDTEDLQIEPLHPGSIEIADVPLPKGKYLSIGHADSISWPFRLKPPRGDVGVTFLKLYFTPTPIDLGWLQQESPFNLPHPSSRNDIRFKYLTAEGLLEGATILFAIARETHDSPVDDESNIIDVAVAMLGKGHASAKFASRVLSKVINETTTLSEEIVLKLVSHLDNSIDDVSQTTSDLLSTLTQYTVIKAALIYHCHTLIGFMESDVTHVQCWVFNVMAMLVDDEKFRATILMTDIFHTVANLLSDDSISTTMLHGLLKSLGRFLYDDLRSSIMQTDMIHALLRLSGRLPKDTKPLLRYLMAKENLSLSFQSNSDDSSSFPISAFQCLIGAQDAMDRVLSEANTLERLFASYQITSEDYLIQAGFNEDQVANGLDHLEEVYVYLNKEIDATHISRILKDLGDLFRPFPCVLLTAEGSHRTPPPSGLELGYESVILKKPDKKHHFLKLTTHSEAQGSPKLVTNDGSGESAPQGEMGGSSGQSGHTAERGEDENENRDNIKKNPPDKRAPRPGRRDNNGDDDDPTPGRKEKRSRQLTSTSLMEVHLPKSIFPSNPSVKGSRHIAEGLFQKFSMHTVVKVEVRSESSEYGLSVSLDPLAFGTEPHPSEKHAYKHHRVQVTVSSMHNPYLCDWDPKTTPAEERATKATEGTGWTGTLNATPSTRSGFLCGLSLSRTCTRTKEVTKFASKIVSNRWDKSVKWMYDIDEINHQIHGLAMEEGRHPRLKLQHNMEEVEKPLTIEVLGHWVTPYTFKKGSRLLSPFTGSHHPVPILRNFRHLTSITFKPSDLRCERKSDLMLQVSMPPSIMQPSNMTLGEKKSGEHGINVEAKVLVDDSKTSPRSYGVSCFGRPH